MRQLQAYIALGTKGALGSGHPAITKMVNDNGGKKRIPKLDGQD